MRWTYLAIYPVPMPYAPEPLKSAQVTETVSMLLQSAGLLYHGVELKTYEKFRPHTTHDLPPRCACGAPINEDTWYEQLIAYAENSTAAEPAYACPACGKTTPVSQVAPVSRFAIEVSDVSDNGAWIDPFQHKVRIDADLWSKLEALVGAPLRYAFYEL